MDEATWKENALNAANGEPRFPNKLWMAFAVLAFCCAPLSAAAADGTLTADMEKLLKSQGLQGAVWATVDAGGSIAVGAAGVSDAGSGAKMRADNRVQVGSVAKTLLATGVLRLVSEGRLSLEAPVTTLLPDVVFDNQWAASDPVRLRHLLDHTAGLDDARLSQVFSQKPGPHTPLAEGFARANSLLRVRSRPGTRFSYSNMSYALLGRVIESVTGERYESYLAVNLLRPLGMHDSTFSFVSQIGPYADRRLAMGHFENGETQVAVPGYLRPAGQFTTTAADMGNLAHFLMSDGRIDGKPFIAAPLLLAMGHPHGTEAANGGLQVGFGLGLATRDRNGAIGKCHGGSTVGYRAMFCLFPQQRKAYFIAMNADNEAANYGLLDELMVTALSLPPQEVPASVAATDHADWEGYYIPAPNRFASFVWLDTVLHFARLRKTDTGLSFKPFQSSEVDLTPVIGGLYRANGRVSASHVLVTASTGERVISTGTQSYEKVSLLKLAPLWGSLLLGGLGLAYIFLSGLMRIASRRLPMSHPLLIPFVSVAAFLLPLTLFYRQSFLQLGDLTLASGTLAAITTVLPLAMLVGLGLSTRHWRKSVPDLVAMLGVLQLTVVLALSGLLPLRLWA